VPIYADTSSESAPKTLRCAPGVYGATRRLRATRRNASVGRPLRPRVGHGVQGDGHGCVNPADPRVSRRRLTPFGSTVLSRLMTIRIIRTANGRAELAAIAEEQFGDMAKAVVDIQRRIMGIGGELHSDEEAALLEDGSRQGDLWGINLYPGGSGPEWIEFRCDDQPPPLARESLTRSGRRANPCRRL